MSARTKRRIRKHRRKWKAIQTHGRGAGPRHTSRSGRTGRIFSVHLKAGGSKGDYVPSSLPYMPYVKTRHLPQIDPMFDSVPEAFAHR